MTQVQPTRRRCIFCRATLPVNRSVEHFPVGKRIAFDPHRGRLWAVCPSCQRWNLAPIEDRWEALEELEKSRRDRGRVMASTENISLIEAADVQLVRVGKARLVEEAWWRYGRELTRRRARSRAVQWVETGAVVGLSLMSGGFFYMFGGDTLNRLARYRKFGRVAWRGQVACRSCGDVLDHLPFRRAGYLYLTRCGDGDPALHLQCMRCRRRGRVGEFQIEGPPADHILRRVMTYHHDRGASEERVRKAADYIDRVGSPDAVAGEVAGMGLRLDYLFDRDRRTQAVALEIAMNDVTERHLLEMEIADLEARWREEEEIAAIADGLLTPVAGMEGLRRRVNGD